MVVVFKTFLHDFSHQSAKMCKNYDKKLSFYNFGGHPCTIGYPVRARYTVHVLAIHVPCVVMNGIKFSLLRCLLRPPFFRKI